MGRVDCSSLNVSCDAVPNDPRGPMPKQPNNPRRVREGVIEVADESKPPMRQIAELIDGIATARAESAETLLAACEVQLIEARFGEKTAFEAVADRDAEIARLKAELAAERDRTTATVTCSRVVPTAAEIRTYMDRLADQPRTGGYVPPPAPPADDPRVAALCIIVRHLAHHTNYRGNQAFDDALLIVNEGRR